MQYIEKGTLIPGYREDAQGFLNLYYQYGKSTDLFYCPYCQLKNYSAEIANLFWKLWPSYVICMFVCIYT